MNLVDNAVRYTPAGGHVTVRTEVTSNNSGSKNIVLSVMDDGPGIAANERERVFDRFYRVLGSDAEGSGLGLAIVREIAKSHGAQVILSGADDKNSGGTIIRVVFEQATADRSITEKLPTLD